MSNVADFLIERLENIGIKHLFCVPGDYFPHFLKRLEESKKIELINTTDEAHAGFAADGYARLNGVGCVAVTYGVGALKVCNPIAGAYAEQSPVIIISGAPGVKERTDAPLHHMVGSFDFQSDIFRRITCAQAILDNPNTAGYEIDKALEAMKHFKQPIYIELPRDVSAESINYDVYTQGTPKLPESDIHNLEDALKEVVTWIEISKHPVLLIGVEITRYQMSRELVKFAEKHQIPIACTLLSKSSVNEMHPLFVGVYAGANSSQSHVREMVESSDCLLVLGEIVSEATFGYSPSKAFQKRDMVNSTVAELKVKNHNYPNVSFTDFCHALFKTNLSKKEKPFIPEKDIPTFTPRQTKLTTVRLFEKINSILTENMVIIADTGDSLLGASDMTMVHQHSFIGPAFYLSMGYAIPASLGVKLASPKSRPIVLVGDGSFQMSSSELSSHLRFNSNPIIFVLNNRGYTTERMIVDGKFNNILDWNYHLVTQLMGGGEGLKVETEEQLEEAVNMAMKSNTFFVINCIVDSKDTSHALKRIGEALKIKAKS
jgi:indolepyruvate decarboxylase